MRLLVVAAVLVAAYLFVARPLLDGADKAVRPATHRVDRLGHCIEHSHGSAHRVFRCGSRF